MSTRLIWDIETGPRAAAEVMQYVPAFHDLAPADAEKFPDAAAWQAHCLDRAALSAITGRVYSIGALRDPGTSSERLTILGNETGDDAGEARILKSFWSAAEMDVAQHPRWDKWDRNHDEPRWVGFNSHVFDLPFLIQRSWALGIMPPRWILTDRGYPHPMFLDLKDRWHCGARGGPPALGEPRRNLDNIARLLGIPGKNGDGAAFARLWMGSLDDRAAAVAYLANDLRMTAHVYSVIAQRTSAGSNP